MSKIISRGFVPADDPLFKQGASLFAPVPRSWADPLPVAAAGEGRRSKKRIGKRKKRSRP